MSENIKPGLVLNSKYVLIDTIGSGSFSNIWLAFDYIGNKCYAIKIHLEGYYEVAEGELHILKNLKKNNSSCINNMVDSFVYDDLSYEEATNDDLDIEFDQYLCIVFELMAGSAYDLIRRGMYAHGLPVPVAKSIIKQVLEGLLALSKIKKYHADIKPENVLVCGLGKYENVVNFLTGHDFVKKNSANIRTLMSKKRKVNKVEITHESLKMTINKMLALIENELKILKESCKDDEIEHECHKYEARNRYCYYNESNYFKNLDKSIKVKLADMGTCLDDDEVKYEIQTRYYRCPEALVRGKINNKCDIWSIGCTLYELVTGEIMFEPEKQIGFNRNRHHVNDIQKIFGPIPDKVIEQIEDKAVMFRKNNLMKNKMSFRVMPLTSILKNKMIGDYVGTEDFYMMCDLLYRMMEYDCDKRLSIEECLAHGWFKDC
jgi:serine/threonine-protein kinase SRPK3